MPTSSPNLGLTIWNSYNDKFDFTQLANNLLLIDSQFTQQGALTVISTPIQFIQSGISLPSNPGNGQLFYLTAAASGFTANTVVEYRGTGWYYIGQPELVTAAPGANNYTGRMIVFTAPSGSFKTGDVAVFNGSTYVKINASGVGQYSSISNALADSPTTGKLAVLTAQDNNLGAGGPYGAYSLVVYNSSSGDFQSVTELAGVIKMYGGASAPTGYLLCDGSTYNTTDYPNLFTAIAYTYGGSAGTFNVPDLRGRTPVGVGTNSTVNALNANEGLSVSNRSPKHNTSITDPGHNHGIVDPGHTHAAAQVQSGMGGTITAYQQGSGFNLPTSTTGVSVQNNISNVTAGPGGTLPTDTAAYLTINFIIKV